MHPDTTTTLLGVFAGALTYWGNVGFQLPHTRQEAVTLLGSCILAALGWRSAGVASPKQE